MKKIILVAVLSAISSCSTGKVNSENGTQEVKEFKSKIDREDTKEILYDLAGDDLMGRKPGTKGYTMASDYVIKFLKSNDIKPFFNDTYKDVVTKQPLIIKGKPVPFLKSTYKDLVTKEVSANIVGIIGDYDNTKPHILLGAHLDHLGKSTNPEDGIYNGANDNASGVTAVMQIAKELHKQKFKQNIIIALFTEEENGLVGSKHLAKRLKKQGVNLLYMLNFEMIGKTLSTGTDKVYLTGFNKSNMAEVMNNAAGKPFAEFLAAAKDYRLYSRSDNYPFYEEFGVPCHTISSFDFKNYKHYHKESDEVTLLDLDNMNDIIKTSSNIIYKMLTQEVQLKNN